MKVLDCFNEVCPIPIIKLQNVLDEIKSGEPYMLVTDHSCTMREVELLCRTHKLAYSVNEPMNGVWEIKITAD